MEVISLHKKEEKGSKVIKINEGYFKADEGLVGDINGKCGNRQVSILLITHKKDLNMEHEGLCTKRFYANIIIECLNINRLHIGQEIIIGDTVQEITTIGKRCFSQCNLIRLNKPCLLSTNVIFTRIIEPGIIRVGDEVNRLLGSPEPWKNS